VIDIEFVFCRQKMPQRIRNGVLTFVSRQV
jgi:hypothetical protein